MKKSDHIYLLGEKFTNEVYPKAPLSGDVLKHIRFDKKDIPLVKPFLDSCENDIKRFMTALDLECVRLEEVNLSVAKRFRKLRTSIEEKVNDIVTTKKAEFKKEDINKELLENFINFIDDSATVLSLNNDEFIETALSTRKFDLLKLQGFCDSSEENMLSYAKKLKPNTMNTWDKAIEKLKEAKELTIIDCSLHDENTFLRFALWHFGRNEKIKQFKINIIAVSEIKCNKIEKKVLEIYEKPNNITIKKHPHGLKDFLK